MQSWVVSPKDKHIAKYIECYWLIDKNSTEDINNFPKLNPEPAAHFIICPLQQRFHYQTSPKESSGMGSHWLYPQQQTLQLDHRQCFTYLGVKFRVGALYSLNIPAYKHPTLNQAAEVDLQQLLGEKDFCVDTILQIAKTDSDRCITELDTLLLPLFNSTTEDQHSELTRNILPLLASHSISELGDKLFCSQRTLERSFNRVTGLTMKQCQSMNKLEAMLEYLYQREAVDIDWAEVAFKFGFSDQPHLIRHLKKQIGLTPKNYAEQRGLTIDIYGGVESR
ncbi:helix-turn-helix domain-containing protein [Shewanella sp. 10N.286.54.B9]|uniref:helix-turn-helix domain-containing protein n=1 Tax=Shewanella sp. 10N.286.54.B9 TaxID=3229719 RepID=UPI00354C66C4